jgi:small subunit ribosomal protein S6
MSRWGLNGGPRPTGHAAGPSRSGLPCSRLRTIRFEPFPGSKGSAWDTAAKLERHEMALYEHIFLARQDVTPQQVEALTEQIKSKIASLGGAVTKVEPWGVKSLAFRIKKNRKAHFTLLNVAAPSEAVVEVERLLSINEDVIRYLTIRVDEHEAGPSAMLRKRDDGDRDERGSRGPRGDRSERADRGDRGERGERPERSDRPDRPPRRPRDDANLGVS